MLVIDRQTFQQTMEKGYKEEKKKKEDFLENTLLARANLVLSRADVIRIAYMYMTLYEEHTTGFLGSSSSGIPYAVRRASSRKAASVRL